MKENSSSGALVISPSQESFSPSAPTTESHKAPTSGVYRRYHDLLLTFGQPLYGKKELGMDHNGNPYVSIPQLDAPQISGIANTDDEKIRIKLLSTPAYIPMPEEKLNLDEIPDIWIGPEFSLYLAIEFFDKENLSDQYQFDATKSRIYYIYPNSIELVRREQGTFPHWADIGQEPTLTMLADFLEIEYAKEHSETRAVSIRRP